MLKIEEGVIFHNLNKITAKSIEKMLKSEKPILLKEEESKFHEIEAISKLIRQNEYTLPPLFEQMFIEKNFENVDYLQEINSMLTKTRWNIPIIFLLNQEFIPVPSFHPVLQFKFPEQFAVSLWLTEMNDFSEEYIEADFYQEFSKFKKFDYLHDAVPISVFLALFSEVAIYDSFTSPFETIKISMYPSYGHSYLFSYEIRKIKKRFKTRKDLYTFIKNERKEIKKESYIEDVYESYAWEELEPCEIEAILTLPRNVTSVYTLTKKQPKDLVAEITYETLKDKTDPKILLKLIEDTFETEYTYNKIIAKSKKVLEGTPDAPSTIMLLDPSEKENARKLINMFKEGIKNVESFKEIKIKNIKNHLFEAAKKIEKVLNERSENKKWKPLAA